MNRPTRRSTAGRVYLDLQRLARKVGRPTDEVFLRYVLERFLFRLSKSSYAERLMLKGGMLLDVFDVRRPTRDIDLAARELAGDPETIRAVVQEVTAIQADDGVAFDIEHLTVDPLREEDVHGGVRARMPAGLDRARVTLAIDVSFGEAVTPRPLLMMFPTLLDTEGFELLSYPLATLLAEKIETMIRRGAVNTRARDFLDVWLLIRRHSITAKDMRAALSATAQQRGTKLRPIGEAVGDLPERRQADWRAYLGRNDLKTVAPATLSEVLALVKQFADPLITTTMADGRWDPALGEWTVGN